jgi:hypothetical protein
MHHRSRLSVPASRLASRHSLPARKRSQRRSLRRLGHSARWRIATARISMDAKRKAATMADSQSLIRRSMAEKTTAILAAAAAHAVHSVC